MLLILDQKKSGSASLVETCIKLIVALICFHGVTSLSSPLELNNTYNSSHDVSVLRWMLHRAGLRANPVAEPVHSNLSKPDREAKLDLFFKSINSRWPSSPPTVLPKKPSTSEAPSSNVLGDKDESFVDGDATVPNVVEDKANQITLVQSSTNPTKKDEVNIPNKGATGSTAAQNDKGTANSSKLLLHDVPYTTKSAATMPNGKSVIPEQIEEGNSSFILSAFTSTPSTSLQARSLESTDESAKHSAVQLSESQFSSATELKVKSSSEVNLETKITTAQSSSISSAHPDGNIDGNVHYTSKGKTVTVRNQDVNVGSRQPDSVFILNHSERSEFSEDHVTRKMLAVVTKELGSPDYSSGEDAEVQKYDAHPASSEDYNEPVIILSTDDRGNAFGLATTIKTAQAKHTRTKKPNLTTPSFQNGEGNEGNRPATRRRGGRKRNRKRSTTSISHATTTEGVTAVSSVFDGNTLKWTVATPMPDWERSRQTRQISSRQDRNDTESDSSSENGTTVSKKYSDDKASSETDLTTIKYKSPTSKSLDTEALTSTSVPTIVRSVSAEIHSVAVKNVTDECAIIIGNVSDAQDSIIETSILPETSDVLFDNFTEVSGDGTFSIEFKQLKPCTDYFVTIRLNSSTTSENKTHFKTLLGVAPAVQNLKAESLKLGEKNILVTWNRPMGDCLDEIKHYNVRFQNTAHQFDENFNVPAIDTSTENFEFNSETFNSETEIRQSFKFNTEYIVEVAAYTLMKGIVSTERVTTRMKQPPPPKITFLKTCSRSITFSYDEVATDADYDVDHYEYCLSVDESCNPFKSFISKEIKIGGLSPGISYYVQVRAVCMDQNATLEGFTAEEQTKTLPDVDVTITHIKFKEYRQVGLEDTPSVTVEVGVSTVSVSSINYTIISSDKTEVRSGDVNAADMSFDIKVLRTCTNYTLELWPSSECGEPMDSDNAVEKSFRTPLGNVAVGNLHANAIPGSRFVEVVWDPLLTECIHEVKRYEITWNISEDTSQRTGKNVTDPAGHTATLELEYYKLYYVSVVVVTIPEDSTKEIKGIPVVKDVFTAMATPEPPKVTKIDVCSRSINFTYEKKTTWDGGVIHYYEYCVLEVSSSCEHWNKSYIEFVSVDGLRANTEYQIQIKAVSNDTGGLLKSNATINQEKTSIDVNIVGEINVSFQSLTTVNATIDGSTVGPTSFVNYRLNNSEETNVSVEEKKFNFMLKDLSTCEYYSLELWPSSNCSPISFFKNSNRTEYFRTPLGAVSLDNLNATAPSSGSTTVDVSWDLWDATKCFEDINRYEISWYEPTSTSQKNAGLPIIVDDRNQQTYRLDDQLEYYTLYTIEFVVITKTSTSAEVKGPPSSRDIRTRMKKPMAPEVTTVQVCSRNLNFTYQDLKPAWTYGEINHYEYCYETSESPHCDNQDMWINVTQNENTVSVSPLSSSTPYVIHFRAVSLDIEDVLNGNITTINEITKPDIEVQPVTVTNITKDFVELEGKTIGPLTRIKWRCKESQEFRDSANAESETWNFTDVTNDTFVINPQNLEYCTEYTVEMHPESECPLNGAAGVTHDLKTLSPWPPSFEPIPVVENIENTTAFVNWTLPPEFVCPIQYNITVRPLDNFHENEEAVIIITKTPTHNLSGLHPYTNYSVSIVAITDAGEGPEINLTVFRTDIGRPVTPKNVTISNCSPTSCAITWSMRAAENGPRSFNVSCNGNETVFDEPRVETTRQTKQFSSAIYNLQPYTHYTCHVQVSINDFVEDSESSEAERTGPGVPEKPKNFEVKCGKGSENGLATWSMPPISNGEVMNFKLNYQGTREGSPSSYCGSGTTVDASGEESYTHSLQLVAECNYTFSIVAKNKDVDQSSDLADESTCFQKASEPPVPEKGAIVTAEQESSVLKFSKDLFSEQNGLIRNYSIIMYAGHKRDSITDVPLKHWQEVYYKDEVEPYVVTPNNWNPFPNSAYRSSNEQSCGKCCLKNQDTVEYKLGCDNECKNKIDEKVPCNGPLQSDKTYFVVIRANTNGGFTDTMPVQILTGGENKSSINATVGVSVTLLAIIVVAGIFIHYRRNDFRRLFFIKPSVESGTQTSTFTISNRTVSRPEQISNFQLYYQSMAADSGLKFSQEYDELKSASPALPHTAADLLENRCKNRWVNILPFDQSRVKLLPISDDVTTDYINACYIPGVNSPREYIATQGPLPGTKDDFWRMVWEQSSQMIVMVTQIVERGKVKCEQYWPNDRDVHYYGDLAVQLRSESILSGFTIRIFDLNLGTKSLEVKQMHFTKWPDFGCPENTELLINFVQAVREHMPHEVLGPIVVHCSAGVGRTGTFIAVDRLLQQLKTDDVIDIYGLVLDMRNYRTNMVQTEDQYVYIHECIRDVLLAAQESSDDGDVLYENFSAITKNRDSQL